jgi:hypothetical protein
MEPMILVGVVLVLSIFALGFLGNEGLGWFASNDKVTANDMGISVNGEFDIVESVEYFAIESITLDSETKDNIYTFKNKLSDGDHKNLGEFSTLVAERQILIKINLNDDVGAVRVTATSSATEYIADETPDISKENNSLSSVVEFYSIAGSSVDTSGGSYVISSESFQGEASRFSSVDVNGSQVTTSVTPYISVYETAEGADDDVIYIIVDYYEDAAEHVMDTSSMLMTNGELVFDDNEDMIITFASDFTISVAKQA